jgi:phosphoribosyl 1,2-cyclic phosphate phosphodiesterase
MDVFPDKSSLKVTILGSGTSHGIPVIGCSCKVCRSADPENSRSRCSAMVQNSAGVTVIIDTAPEFRLQAIRAGVERVDAVFYTHAHADHLHGLDDLRPLGRSGAVPLYGSALTLEEIESRFSYIFSNGPCGGGKPRVDLLPLLPGEEMVIDGIPVMAVPLLHGTLPVYGYRIGDFAYLTDCSSIPAPSYPLLSGVKYLVLDALREKPHPTHFSFSQALEVIAEIAPERAWFTHICHDSDHYELAQRLPDGVAPAWDGLTFFCSSAKPALAQEGKDL